MGTGKLKHTIEYISSSLLCSFSRYPGYYDGFELEEAKESYEIAKQCLNTFKNTL